MKLTKLVENRVIDLLQQSNHHKISECIVYTDIYSKYKSMKYLRLYGSTKWFIETLFHILELV